jgi:hypothetical protein
MQWETSLLLILAAPFVLYYVLRDRISQLKRPAKANEESQVL